MSPAQILILAIASGVAVIVARAAIGWLEARRIAAELWASGAWSDEVGAPPHIADTVTEPAFRRAFLAVHGPRGALYAGAAALAVAAATPVALTVLPAVWRAGWTAAGRPQPFEPGLIVWQFYLFFGLIALWVGVAALVLRTYHSRRPRSVADLLTRASDSS